MDKRHHKGGGKPCIGVKAELRLSASLHVTAVNEDYYLLFPCKHNKPEGLTLTDILPGSQGKALALLLAAAASGGETLSFQFPLSCGGEMINCACEYTPAGEGGTLRFQPVNYISKAEAFRGIYKRVTTGLYRTDREGSVLMANPAFAHMLGYGSAEELLPFSIPDDAYKDKHKRHDFVKLLEQEGSIRDYQVVWKKRDGEDLYVLKNAVAVFDDAGALQCIDGSVQDVTDRYLTMHELIESRAQLRALTAHIQAVREEERTAISREVHDEVGQVMSSLMLNLTVLTKELESSSVENLKELVENELRSMSRVIETSVKKLKNKIALLRPQELETLGLLPAIEELLNDYRTKIPLEIDFEYNDEQISAAGDVALAVYRIIQEALTNIVRHSGADHVAVKLRKNNRWLTVTVDDNGCGIENAGLNGSSSFGLLGMRERAIILGGSLKIESSPSGGASIQLTIPLHH